MKKKLFLLATIIAVFQSFTVNAQNWEYSNAFESDWLMKICTQGLDTVYIVGDNGLVAKSTDRAKTWNKQYHSSEATLNDIIFINDTIGFIVGANGTILKTIDAGKIWTQVTSGTTENINAIAATGLDNIWAVGDNGLILYSHDGGDVWNIKDLSLATKLNDISFRNGIGYIVGNMNTYYKTNNYGVEWSKENFNLKNEFNEPIDSFNLFSISQTSNSSAYVIYGIDNRPLYLNFDNQFLINTPDISCYTMANDSIGYGVWASTTTNGAHSIIILKIKNGNYLEETRLYPKNNQINQIHSDIVILNESTGYLVSGNFLYKICGIVDGENDIIFSSKITLRQIDQKLVISSFSKKIQEIELMTLSGMIIRKYKGNQVDITNIPSGLYLVKAVFANKSYAIKKWIKK